MRLAELDPQATEKIKAYRYDRIIEKHEGPEHWAASLEYHEWFVITDNPPPGRP
jgi:hypothetical protein